MRDKKVGVWCCGNQFELYAALDEERHRPENQKGVKIFNQPFDMNDFLQQQIDAAAAMTYNELAQVLETKNPKTGKLYTLTDLNVFPLQNDGTAMLEDGLFATSRTGWTDNQDSRCGSSPRRPRAGSTAVTTRGVHEHRAQERHDARPTATSVADERDQQARSGRTRAASASCLPAAFKRTAAIAHQVQGDQEGAAAKAYRRAALESGAAVPEEARQGVNTKGTSYKPIAVKVTAGGK